MPQIPEVITADITTLSVDSVVNAANSSLLGGGGVDGAIHRKAGPLLVLHCLKLGGCKVGQAKVTPGFNLPAPNIIHTVGPFWSGGNRGEPEFLASCYRESLLIAIEKGFKSVAFPSISTGIFRYPIELAAQVAISTVAQVLDEKGSELQVIFCCFSEPDAAVYRSILSR